MNLLLSSNFLYHTYHLISFNIDSNWIIGDMGETCQTVCLKNFKICDADEQSKITNETLFKAAMLDAGHHNVCTNHTQRKYYGVPFLADGGKTCVSGYSGFQSMCGTTDERARSSQRLCFCGKALLFNVNSKIM